MSETIETKLDALRAEVGELRAFVEEALRPRPTERPDDLVGAAYVASLFGCSVSSVRCGKAGTRYVEWIARRPLKTTRREAHAALARYEALRQRRTPGLIRRKPRG
jgi:hypothetical protein